MKMAEDNQQIKDNPKIKYIKALKAIFTGPNSEIVLKQWESQYVLRTALGETSELTHYRLGQKELIQGILNGLHFDIDALNKQTEVLYDE